MNPRTLVLFPVLFSVSLLMGQTAFFEDWENGIDTGTWRLFGSPLPILLEGLGYTGGWGFDCNGDNSLCSGGCLYWNYSLSDMPRFRFQALGHQSTYHWQYIAAGFGEGGYASYAGGYWDQPDYITGISIEPKITSSAIIYFAGEDSLVEDWIPELHNDTWMSFDSRLNSDGTVSFFRNDTLRFRSTEGLDTDLWQAQAFALKGQSFNHPQVIDDICVSPASFRENWESGMNFVYWKPWGSPGPEILPGAGWQGSSAMVTGGGESWPCGASSYQTFDLMMFPVLDFMLRTEPSSPSHIVQAGWSTSNSSGYQGSEEQPELLASISVEPGTGMVSFTAGPETSTSPWRHNGVWVNCSIRVNQDGTVSFFTADTLRWTSSAGIDLFQYGSQCVTVQGISSGSIQAVDEIAVYPSFYLPGGFLLPLNAIYFLDQYTGWAVGDNGAIVHTDDGGASWSQQPTGLLNNLNDIHFETDTRGWICCDSGSVLNTFDGVNWIPSSTGYSNNLNGVGFADNSLGWTAGDGSLILKTANGGFDWVQQSCPFTGNVTDVDVVNTTTAFASGQGGHLIRTTDGVSWTGTPTGVTVDLNGLSFISPQTGWAVGNGGTILKTENGGNSWAIQESGVTGDLFGVSFYDEEHGWIVGEAGIVLYSENSGETWVLQPGGRNESPDVLDVHACLEDAAWGVSPEGLIGLTGGVTGLSPEAPSPPKRLFAITVNPCRVGGNLYYSTDLPLPGSGTLRVYDITGRTVLTELLEPLPAGHAQGSTELVEGMSAGVYFAVFSQGGVFNTDSFVILPGGGGQ